MVHSHVFAGNSSPVRSRVALFANRTLFRAYSSFTHSQPIPSSPTRSPKTTPPKQVFYSISPYSSSSHQTFASRLPLLAVIFRCENAPDSQTSHGAGISQNISAVFSRISAIWGSGTLHGKIFSDGEAVQVKEQVFSRFWGEF